MKRYFVLLLVIVGINSCSIMQMIIPHEQIAGVEIVSVEDIENNDGDIQREVKGVVPAPFDTDEEWYVAFQAIYSQKKVPGKDTVIKIYLEDESWDLGTPFAVGKYRIDKRAAIKVEERLIKVKTP